MATVNYDLKNGTTSKKEEGRGGWVFLKRKKTEGKRGVRSFVAGSLAMFCDLPLRLIGS